MTFSLKGLKTITNYQYEPACGILSLLDILNSLVTFQCFTVNYNHWRFQDLAQNLGHVYTFGLFNCSSKQECIPVEKAPPARQLHMFWWTPLDVSNSGEGIGPQVNKFEQVSSDVRQMSVPEGGEDMGGSWEVG